MVRRSPRRSDRISYHVRILVRIEDGEVIKRSIGQIDCLPRENKVDRPSRVHRVL